MGTVTPLGGWDQLRRLAERRHDFEHLNSEPRAISELSVLEACHAVKALGVEEAGLLLAHLAEDQTRSLFDLEVWSGSTLSPSDALSWLLGFREAGTEALLRAIRSWDREAVILLLARRLHVAIKPTEDTPAHEIPSWLQTPDDDLEVVPTPDGRYLIAARRVDAHAEAEGEVHELDEEERAHVLLLVSDLYADEEWEHAASLLEAAMSDDSFDLEELALRFRDARNEELGFPSVADAMSIFEPDSSPTQARPAAGPVASDLRLAGPYIDAIVALREGDWPLVRAPRASGWERSSTDRIGARSARERRPRDGTGPMVGPRRDRSGHAQDPVDADCSGRFR
ncbi:MAG: hypothetical protein HC923_05340 [Myxococcales bacterium]|nr:hypothetical protein [Myxococcales bacterium]